MDYWSGTSGLHLSLSPTFLNGIIWDISKFSTNFSQRNTSGMDLCIEEASFCFASLHLNISYIIFSIKKIPFDLSATQTEIVWAKSYTIFTPEWALLIYKVVTDV